MDMTTTAVTNLRNAIASAPTLMLIETYRRADETTPANAVEWSSLAAVRGAITTELEARHPGIVECWSDALDRGEEEPDLMRMFEAAAIFTGRIG